MRESPGKLSWEAISENNLCLGKLSRKTLLGSSLEFFLENSLGKLSWDTLLEIYLGELSSETLLGNSLGNISWKALLEIIMEHFLG